MNKLRQSFRRKKDVYVPESSRPHQWQTDEEAVRGGKCSFQVKVNSQGAKQYLNVTNTGSFETFWLLIYVVMKYPVVFKYGQLQNDWMIELLNMGEGMEKYLFG